jgi:hypothetical protein
VDDEDDVFPDLTTTALNFTPKIVENSTNYGIQMLIIILFVIPSFLPEYLHDSMFIPSDEHDAA